MSQKLFRVTKSMVQVSGVVPLVLAEENDAIYAWDTEEAPAVVAAQPNTFDPLQEPIRLAIDDAAETANWSAVANDNGRKASDYADKTSLNTAAGIAGQGAFATLSNAAYGSSLLTGFGNLAGLGSIYFGSSFLLEDAGGAPATLAAFKTILGQAYGILGQGPWLALKPWLFHRADTQEELSQPEVRPSSRSMMMSPGG